MLLLDYADWGEVLSTYELLTFDTIYPWFYVGESNTFFVTSLFKDLWQVIFYLLDSIQSTAALNSLTASTRLNSVGVVETNVREVVLSEIIADLKVN